MKLLTILSQVKTPFEISCDPTQIEVSDIAIDSRLVTKNSAFFALQGKTQNGSKFITDAIKNGAAIIVLSKHEARSTKHESIICEKSFTLPYPKTSTPLLALTAKLPLLNLHARFCSF